MMGPGRELDAEVAEKVMGWTKDGTPINWWLRPDGLRVEAPAPYSTDISAAWEVVEKLVNEPGYPKQFHIATDYMDKTCKWMAFFLTPHTDLTKRDMVAETAPHAICLAALKAVGE